MADAVPPPAASLATGMAIAFPGASDAYVEARRALLVEEIELRRRLTAVTD